MRDPFQGYDQWKTASPYDDDPDLIEEAERFVEEVGERDMRDLTPTERWAYYIIQNMLSEI